MLRWCSVLRVGLAATLVCALVGATPAYAARAGDPKPTQSGNNQTGDHGKLDRELNDRDHEGKAGTSRVIIQLKPGWDTNSQQKSGWDGNSQQKSGWDGNNEVTKAGGKFGRKLALMNGIVAELPNKFLRKLADNPAVERIIWDRPLDNKMNRVAITVGARSVNDNLGYKGAGVGVAVIDSGVSPWHDDLTYLGSNNAVRVKNGQRVAAFVDFVGGRSTPYDDYGHGTHVSGIISGNGFDTLGSRAGIAPDSHLVSLKVLDGRGRGVISNVIAALDWAVANKAAYNIRVINLSVGAAVTESYKTDPLTLAAKRAVDAGIVVVVAAGNLGKNALGQVQYGGITAPANAPWVLTVGAYSHEGTVIRTDDKMALFSSRGPSAIDYQAKPDVVAPGVGTVSLADPASLMYLLKPAFLLKGLLPRSTSPYLSLSGTSMSAPVVAGTVALMYQANPNLTPNLVKAILMYTAEQYPGYNALTQGAGFINSRGAVDLAKYFKNPQEGEKYPLSKTWSKKLLWGNHRVRQGVLKPNASAFAQNVIWGAEFDTTGRPITWGQRCRSVTCEDVVWGDSAQEARVVTGVASAAEDNIVWGTLLLEDNIVWGTLFLEDNIVWGTACGGADCPGIVWGTAALALLEDNIVWGTALLEDNIVWGTSGVIDPIVWGMSEDNITWGTSGEETPLFDDPLADPVTVPTPAFEDLFGTTLTPPALVATPVEAPPVVAPPTTTIPTPTTGLPVIGGVL